MAAAAMPHRSPAKLPSVTQAPTRPYLRRHNQVCRIKIYYFGMLWCVSSSVQNPLFRRRLCPARGRKGGSSTRNWDSASTGSPLIRLYVTINIELPLQLLFLPFFSLQTTWKDAAEHCQRLGRRITGSRLAEVTSKEIHELIIKKLASTPGIPISCLRSFGDTDVSPLSSRPYGNVARSQRRKETRQLFEKD